MATIEELIADIESGDSGIDTKTPLSDQERILGTSRSWLAGPTFGFNDEIEAALAVLPSALKANMNSGNLFGSDMLPLFRSELADINKQQKRYKEITPYLDNALEITSGAVLNPLGKIASIAKGKGLLPTLGTIAANPAVQGGVYGVGSAEPGEDLLKSFAKGATIGTAGSMAANVLGRGLEQAGKQAQKLKLSAYGITNADITREVKKILGLGGKVDDISIVKTVDKAEKIGAIKAGSDVTENLAGTLRHQEKIAGELNPILELADEATQPFADFQRSNAQRYVNSLSGTARNEAQEALDKETQAIIQQFENGGSILDLQKAKIGLNYKFEQGSYKPDVIKKLREDLKEEIENRVNIAARTGKISPKLEGQVKQLNKEWGSFAELSDAFKGKVAKDYGNDVVEQVFNLTKTTGGAAGLGIAGIVTKRPELMAAQGILNMARFPEAKSRLADILRTGERPLMALGRVLQGTQETPLESLITGETSRIPAPITSRTTGTMVDSLFGDKADSLFGTGPATIVINPKDTAENVTPSNASSYDAEIQDLLNQLGSDVKKKGVSSTVKDEDFERLVDAVIQVESAGNPKAVSNKGARGLMQIMPETAKEIAAELGVTDYDLTDPDTSRLFGSHYLRKQLGSFGDDPRLALAAYNAGPGAVEKYGNTIPPYDETQDYVKKVLGIFNAG